MRPLALLLALSFGTVAGVAGGAGANWIVPESPIVRGVYVGERRIPDREGPDAWLAARRDEAKSRVVRFGVGDRTFESTLGEVGVEIDVGATLAQARRVGHAGAVWSRLRETARARRGAVDVPLVWSIDEARARSVLERWAPEVARAAVDARLDLKNRAKIPETPGRALDLEASLDALRAATHEDEEYVPLVTREVPAKVRAEDLVNVAVDKVLSTHETVFQTFGSGVGRSINIRNAASKIDGVIIPPGEIFSFNDVVGPRTLQNGFAIAPEIMGDETTPGVGGGTCQVSSTLHIAALFGALEVVERQSHSRPSAYAPMGLDATVSYPTVDLKIRNPMPFSVMIRAYVPEPTKELSRALSRAIRVEVLGGEPVAKVSYRYGVGNVENFTRRIYTKSFLKPGKRIRHQKGTRGYSVTSWVKIEYFDGRVEERSYYSGYRPAPEVFWVAPGYDEAELPPLPEHAKGVDNRRTDVAQPVDESREGESLPM